MEPGSKYRIGLRYGFATGLVYLILLFCRYKFFSSNPRYFTVCAVISYFIILMMYLFTAIARKNELGGFAGMKEIFSAVFIVIVITELVYVVFNITYFKMVDPAFWQHFEASTLTQLQMARMPNEQIDQQMKSFKDMEEQFAPGNLIKGYGMNVIIDSIFGLIFAIILRKPHPPVKKITEDPK